MDRRQRHLLHREGEERADAPLLLLRRGVPAGARRQGTVSRSSRSPFGVIDLQIWRYGSDEIGEGKLSDASFDIRDFDGF